jgi:hypothetical protein
MCAAGSIMGMVSAVRACSQAHGGGARLEAGESEHAKFAEDASPEELACAASMLLVPLGEEASDAINQDGISCRQIFRRRCSRLVPPHFTRAKSLRY